MRSQLLTYEHEGNWSKAVESYDLLLRSKSSFQNSKPETTAPASVYSSLQQDRQYQKGLMKSLRQMGCTHVVDLCYQSLSHQGNLEKDPEFKELQYEAAWRACHWDTNLLSPDIMEEIPNSQIQGDKSTGFNAHLHRWDAHLVPSKLNLTITIYVPETTISTDLSCILSENS